MAILPKPKPKKDLVVTRDRSEENHTSYAKLKVSAANAAARAWVLENCNTFGQVYGGTESHRVMAVYVYAYYDIDEVIAYIESYNDRMSHVYDAWAYYVTGTSYAYPVSFD